MRRHRIRGHGREKKLRCHRQQEHGEEGVLSFVRPDVARSAVKGEHGDGGEKRVERKLEMHCLKKRAQPSVGRQISCFPRMRHRQVIDVNRFDHANGVTPLRWNFRSDFSVEENLGLEVGHEFVRTERIIVANKVRAEAGNSEDEEGDDERQCLASRYWRFRRRVTRRDVCRRQVLAKSPKPRREELAFAEEKQSRRETGQR